MVKLRVFRWGDFPGYYHNSNSNSNIHSGSTMQSHVAFYEEGRVEHRQRREGNDFREARTEMLHVKGKECR